MRDERAQQMIDRAEDAMREAEQLSRAARYRTVDSLIARAQVYATLAVARAIEAAK